MQLVNGGDAVATLSIWGRFKKAGYSVKIYAANATGNETSELIHSSGTDLLTYSATLSHQSIPSPADVRRELLKLDKQSNNDLRVLFQIRKNANEEVSSSSPHEALLTFHLDAFDPFAKESGTYSDQITAIVSIN